jgi:hypothetical protein
MERNSGPIWAPRKGPGSIQEQINTGLGIIAAFWDEWNEKKEQKADFENRINDADI